MQRFATVKTIDPPITSIAGSTITALDRRAKRLLIGLEGGLTLVIHPMAAGRITLGAKRMRSAVLVLALESGEELVLAEPGRKRRAAAWLWDAAEVESAFAATGPEPLNPSFTPDRLRQALEARPGRLHAFLRDQRAIAGIGRAYANEILHTARLSPFARTATLMDEEVERLWQAITETLAAAVERLQPLSGGGLVGHAKRGHSVHDRLGEPCPRCGEVIRRVDFDEHTIYYCARCQTGGRVLADRRLSRLLRE